MVNTTKTRADSTSKNSKKRKKTRMSKSKNSRQHCQQSKVGIDGSASALECGVQPVPSFTPAKLDKDAYEQLKISTSELDSMEEKETRVDEYAGIIAYAPVHLEVSALPSRSDVPPPELMKIRDLNSPRDCPPLPAKLDKDAYEQLKISTSELDSMDEKETRVVVILAPEERQLGTCAGSARSDVPPLEVMKIRGLNSTRDHTPVPPGGSGGSKTKPSGGKGNIFTGCLGR